VVEARPAPRDVVATRRSAPQAGYSLVELLIYMSFAVVVLTIIGGMLISTLAAERTISGRTGASTAGQIITQSIQAGVRNARALQTTENANGPLLSVANVGNAAIATPYCQSWFYDPAPPGVVYYRRTDSAAQPITAPTPTQLASDGWLRLGSGVTPGPGASAPWQLSEPARRFGNVDMFRLNRRRPAPPARPKRLNRPAQRGRGLPVAQDSGVALIAVIGVMAVIAIIIMTVAGTTLTALGVTSATRASVQAQAAAEAGIAAATVSLAHETCPAPTSSRDSPLYTLALSYQLAGDQTWIVGCPAAGSERVRVLSTGTAAARGTANNASGDTRTVEAIFGSAAVAPVTPAAISAYSGVAFTGSSQLQLQPGAGSQPAVQAGGDVSCAGSNVLNADVVIPVGTLTLARSCQFFGNAQVAAAAELGGSAIIHGNLSALSLASSGSSIITGDAAVVRAATLKDSSQVQGDLSAETLVTTDSARVGGAITLTPGGPPPAASAPRWVDFSYLKPDWTGFVKKSASGLCNFVTLQPLVADISSPVLIDARGCSGGIRSVAAEILTLSNDLVLIANSFQLGGSAQFQSVASDRLWLITPDETDDGVPTCTGGVGASAISDSFIAGTGVTALLYSPCAVEMRNSAIWHGQFYGNSVGVGGSSILQYQPLAFPGVHASSVPRSGVFELGARESLRDVVVDARSDSPAVTP